MSEPLRKTLSSRIAAWLDVPSIIGPAVPFGPWQSQAEELEQQVAMLGAKLGESEERERHLREALEAYAHANNWECWCVGYPVDMLDPNHQHIQSCWAGDDFGPDLAERSLAATKEPT